MILHPLLNKIFLAFSLLCFPLFGEESALYSLFSPPQTWEVSNPATLAPRVKIGFFGKTKKTFTPSMNLAEEHSLVSLENYLKIIQKLHESNKRTRWRNLGTFQTKAGSAILTEIDTKVDVGDIRILQLIYLKDRIVYLLTAASLKEEFPSYQKEFLQSFRSLNLVQDLTGVIEDFDKKQILKEKTETLLSSLEDPLFQKKHWTPFQDFILNEFKKQGSYWQILFLASIQQKTAPTLSKKLS